MEKAINLKGEIGSSWPEYSINNTAVTSRWQDCH